MNYSHDCDATFTPSMPVVEIAIQHIETGKRSEVITAIINSGADSCILPARFLNAIGSEAIRRSQIVGATLSIVWPRRRDWQVDTVWEYQRKSAHYATVTLPVDWDAHQVYNKSVQVDVQIISISGWGSQWIEPSILLKRAISFLRL